MNTMNDTLGIRVMNNQLKKKFLAATIATVGVMPVLAYAQTHAGHAGHTAAPPATSSPATASGMNHGSMNMRSQEHSSELQSLMRTSYAVFCLKNKTRNERWSRRDEGNTQYNPTTQPQTANNCQEYTQN